MSIQLIPKIQFMSMTNQCDLLPRITIVAPWDMDQRFTVFFAFLWWMVAIQWGECPWVDE